MTVTLVTCSGVSNTGKLTAQAALTLLHRRPGQYTWVDARQSTKALETGIGNTGRVIVLDGCPDSCAFKKLSSSRIGPTCHIIATDLGIEKNGMAEVRFHEIERVVRAVMDADTS